MITGISLRLSQTQQDYLIDHVDGFRPVVMNNNENQTRTSLFGLDLIRYSDPQRTKTVLTKRGREVLCAVLAHWADRLTFVYQTQERTLVAYLPKEYVGHWRDWSGN